MTTNTADFNRNNQGRGNPQHREAPRPNIDTSDVQLKDIQTALFSEIAENKAQVIAQGKSQNTNNSTQLRRFYDELVMWFEKVHFERTPEDRKTKYQEVAPFIQMLIAKVAYAKGRKHVDESFETLFAHLIRQISDAESLRHAKLFMEAFMGFYKAQEK
ncbi:MAG: type III-A CRISPR-associated protein Csm2 [Azonexus sp.]|jgi:CRISPR-associated protein Csm2|uniref:type III-A CRISPR-associated protein Csm2 n=1 Tax=Azonexus sp. TaxID=1872668 RepID=UPI00282C14F6|nr:type III-A CRISPR-associated protein Csm2 [Azonexus sp.]MDR0776286.1 type III-A CRISPR-associated protein Csm2 [Azonexus sp.]